MFYVFVQGNDVLAAMKATGGLSYTSLITKVILAANFPVAIILLKGSSQGIDY